MNIDDLETNTYCLISLKHNIIDQYPKFVGKHHTSNIVVLYKGHYTNYINNKQSYIFEHTVKNAHYLVWGAFTHVCINFIRSQTEMFWESHIYKGRLVVNKILTETVKKVVSKFKSLLENKKIRLFIIFKRCGIPNDLNWKIIDKYYGRS